MNPHRTFVDALRGALGLDPLYLQETATSGLAEAEFLHLSTRAGTTGMWDEPWSTYVGGREGNAARPRLRRDGRAL